MPKRGSPNIKCTVIGCKCEWVTVSKNRHYFCGPHMRQANALYKAYKEINAEAIITFEDGLLKQSISMREEYATRFLDYIDRGAHAIYIDILKQVLSKDMEKRQQTYDSLMTSNAVYFPAH